jgi:type VI secretion system protein ImpJ
MTRPGVLDMKIGSGDRVDGIFEGGRMGLEFTPTPNPPRSLPVQAGLVYFQVNRATKAEEWENVKKSRTLALRVNENRVMGAVEGQHEIEIRAGGEPRPIRFTLFLTPRDAG